MRKRNLFVMALLLIVQSTYAQDLVEVWTPEGTADASEYNVKLNSISGLKSYGECMWRPRTDVPYAVLKAVDSEGRNYYGICVYTGTKKTDIVIERFKPGDIGPSLHVLHVGGDGPPVPPNPPNPEPNVPPTPDPTLTGFAKMVFDAAAHVEKKYRDRDAPYLAIIYGAAARGMKVDDPNYKPEQAIAAIQNGFNISNHGFSKQWQPIVLWYNKQVREKAKTVKEVQQALLDIERGITSAGK